MNYEVRERCTESALSRKNEGGMKGALSFVHLVIK